MDRRKFLGSVFASSVATGLAACVPDRVLAEAVAPPPATAPSQAAPPPRTGTAHRASVTDFGADPTGRQDATAAVRRAIASLSRSSARLVFPAGRYSFAASGDVAMRFEGYDGLEVFGNGADLLFDGNTQPLEVTRCSNVEVHDVKLDWARPPFSQGTVVEALPGSFTVAIDPEFPVSGLEQVESFTQYDAKTGLPAAHGVAANGTITELRTAGRQRWHVALSRDAGVRTGMRLVFRHRTAGAPAIHVQGSDMVLLESVGLYGGPGHGAVLEGCRDVSLEDVTVSVRPGTRRLLSLNGDGVRLLDCHGALSIKRSGFRSMGGNAVVIHQPFWRLRSRVDDRVALVESLGGKPFASWELPENGSILQFNEGNRLTLLGEIGLASAEPAPGGAKLTFKETLSPMIGPGTLVCNALAQPRTAVDHCSFGGNGGDALVLHGRAHITNSHFSGSAGAALAMAADTTRMQGPTVQSVTVGDNTFENCNSGQGSSERGTIQVGVTRAQAGSNEERVNQGITIERNIFTQDGGAAIRCASASWVTIEGNIFGRADGMVAGAGTPQAIVLRNVDQSFLESNQSKAEQHIVLIGCTEKVQSAQNVLLTEVRQA